MKLTNLIATGTLLVAFAVAPVLSNAQNGVKKEEDKKAANVAQRNRAEKNGHPKQAVKDEKKVQQDNKQIKADKAK
jgi:hypothetical protein